MTGAVVRRRRSRYVYAGPEVDGVQPCCTESSEGDGGAVKPRRSQSLELDRVQRAARSPPRTDDRRGGASLPLPLRVRRIDRSCTESSELDGVQRRPMTGAMVRGSPAHGWRRRESNPGPRGFQCTFVHVRSRCVPTDWVRGFGRDLAQTVVFRAIESPLARRSPSGYTLGVPGRSPLRMAQRFSGRESECIIVRTYTSRLMGGSGAASTQIHRPSPRRSRSPPWVTTAENLATCRSASTR